MSLVAKFVWDFHGQDYGRDRELKHALVCFTAYCAAAGIRVSTFNLEATVPAHKPAGCYLQVLTELLPTGKDFEHVMFIGMSEAKQKTAVYF